MPFFEAGTEVFVRDWQKSECRIVVRDARTREHDPIMGLNSIDLTELFSTSSQVTRAFPLQDGVGYGRVHASFVFKAVKLDLSEERILNRRQNHFTTTFIASLIVLVNIYLKSSFRRLKAAALLSIRTFLSFKPSTQ